MCGQDALHLKVPTHRRQAVQEQVEMEAQQQVRAAAVTGLPSESFRQRVSPTCVAEVTLEGEPTQQAIEKLIAHLNLMKDTLPRGN